MSREPKLPKNTCPDIDFIISTLEQLREANSLLREYGEWHRYRADDLEKELEELKSDYAELEEANIKLEEKLLYG